VIILNNDVKRFSSFVSAEIQIYWNVSKSKKPGLCHLSSLALRNMWTLA